MRACGQMDVGAPGVWGSGVHASGYAMQRGCIRAGAGNAGGQVRACVHADRWVGALTCGTRGGRVRACHTACIRGGVGRRVGT